MTNTSPLPSIESQKQIESYPSDTKALSDATLLIALQAWVLRLMADPKSKPGQVLNALRRLEMLKEFPWRMEKQARTLALAEARLDLRRRALHLREAQLREKREKREIAAAKALAKASAKAARTSAKAEPVAPKPAQAPMAVAAMPVTPSVPVLTPIVATLPVVSQSGMSKQTDWKLMPLTSKAFGPQK
jgi:hypothetical protein